MQRTLPAVSPSRLLLILALAAAALFSLTIGVRQALEPGGSIDLQWSGAHILTQHQDPYYSFLHGDPGHEILLSQIPNYLHEHYLMLMPLGLLPFATAVRVWCAFNLLAAFAAIFLVRRILRLTGMQTLWTALLFLSCTPLRVLLANAQASMLYLLLALAVMSTRSSTGKGLWLGLSWSKYSFAPVFFFTWLLQRRWIVLACAMVAPLIGFLVMHHLVHVPWRLLLLEPLRSANISISAGYGDIMTLTRELAGVHAGEASSKLRVLLPYIVSLGLTLACALWLAVKKLDEQLEFAIILTLSLLLYPHLDYDFVVLLYPLALALRSPDPRRKAPCIAAICILWFGPTIVTRLNLTDTLPVLLLNALLLIVLTCSLARLGGSEQTSPQCA
jgi:hypothetical protein